MTVIPVVFGVPGIVLKNCEKRLGELKNIHRLEYLEEFWRSEKTWYQVDFSLKSHTRASGKKNLFGTK